MNHRTSFAFLFVILVFRAIPILGQTTQFTHHGNVGFSVTTTYDFRFGLYDTATVGTGTQVGALVDKPGVAVTNGDFTVTGIDFGAAVFSGGELFLETAWSPAGSGIFTTLSPREKITAVHANRSLSAATADTAANASQLGGLPPSGFIQNGGTQQSGGFNITGSGTVGGTLSAGAVNATTQYSLNGSQILAGDGFNLFVGAGTGSRNSGFANSFVGPFAGTSNGSGFRNSFFGSQAGQANTGGAGNSFFGSLAGFANITGNDNSFFGTSAGASNTSGTNNAFFGQSAGYANTSAGENAFFGGSAGAASIGAGNSFFGASAGSQNTGGQYNVFVGRVAGMTNTTGSYNTLLGYGANVGSNNLTNATAIGSNAQVDQSNSLVLGSISGVNFATADAKIGIGTTAPAFRLHVIDPLNQGLRVQTNRVGGAVASFGGNGDFQIDAPGIAGGRLVVKESGNIGIGTTGPKSKLDVSGAGVVRVRVNSDSNAGLALTLLDQPWWSVAATTGGNFQIFNDTSGRNAVLIDASNNVGIGTTAPQARLDVLGFIRANFNGGGSSPLCRNDSGQIAWCSSSLRYKTNIAPFQLGLSLVNRLRPITFNWKASGEADLGLGAEDVAKVEPLLVTHNEKGEIEGVKYDRVAVVLLNAIREQQVQINQQNELIKEQQERLEALTRLVCKTRRHARECN